MHGRTPLQFDSEAAVSDGKAYWHLCWIKLIHRLLTMRNKTALFATIAFLVLAVGAAGAVWHFNKAPAESETDGDLAQLSLTEPATAAPATADTAPETTSPLLTASTVEAAAEPTLSPADLHVVAVATDPKEPRSVGLATAPVTMTEFSSLTCPHCAAAHAHVLPQLIKDYVETGKLRIVFNDFPLNAQAMDASKVSRCVSNEQYFGFISLIFSTIEQWSDPSRHPNALIQDAVLSGLSDEKARACLADKDVEQAIVAGVQTGIEKYAVNATPTFVFNDGAKVLQGARPYAEFKTVIEDLLAKAPK